MKQLNSFIEIKRHLNKADERYECELIRKEVGRVILKYVSDRPFASSRLGITFPPGCSTLAFYREDRPYVFWAIHLPAGELAGYLVHVCTEIHIADKSVSYLDLLLDIWFFPDGRHVLLDENEVDECLQAGVLSIHDLRYITAAKETAIANFTADAEDAATVAAILDISGGSP